MKILLVGPLGAGKSSLAYEINKRVGLSRLNLDEVCRNPKDGSYYSQEEQFAKLETFLSQNNSWVAEGCQKYLYEKMQPDLIVDMRINRLTAIWRFTTRFFKAKKLIGKTIDKNLPIQAYHYRKPIIAKIRSYDAVGQEINEEFKEYLKTTNAKVITCKSFNDYNKVFREIENES
ncbi:MAG: hypothetical protein R3Y43_06870 [Alphaproteobacteria bacterium]